MLTKVILRLISLAVLLSASAFAVDGVVLINQATVVAAGGFPYKITQSGSYKLSGNLVVTAANIAPTAIAAIEIDADNVTLDLGGFTISGPNVCSGIPLVCTTTIHAGGIDAHLNDAIAVSNGAVRGMTNGVSLAGNDESVENVIASNNALTGITVLNGVVRHCITSRNGTDGIEISEGVAQSNNVALNGKVGISIGAGVAEANSVFGNGIDGIDATAVTVSGNAVISNGIAGLSLNGGIADRNTLKNPTNLLVVSGITNHNNSCSGAAC